VETFLQQRGGVTEESLGPRIEDEQPRLVEAEPRASMGLDKIHGRITREDRDGIFGAFKHGVGDHEREEVRLGHKPVVDLVFLAADPNRLALRDVVGARLRGYSLAPL